MAVPSKKKWRQYSVQYLFYGFFLVPNNQTKSICLLCTKVLSNDSMKPCKLKIHRETKHKEKKINH